MLDKSEQVKQELFHLYFRLLEVYLVSLVLRQTISHKLSHKT